MNCEVCGADTTIHITELQDDGTSVERHLCHMHAVEVGLSLPSEQQAIAMVPRIRTLVEFLRANGRMPSPLELPHPGGFTDLSDEELGSDELTRRIKYLQEFADFIERNQRFPTEEELPDQF